MTMHGEIKRGATRRVIRGELREHTNGETALTHASMMTLRTVAGTFVLRILGHSDVMTVSLQSFKARVCVSHPLFGPAWQHP